MAKTLNQFLEGYLKVKNPDEQKFVDKHVTAKHSDRNGNGDDAFKGKTKQIDRRKERHGYNPGEDEKVYEELKGGQHKIDANKNGKVDAHDFKLLRKKKMKEQIDPDLESELKAQRQTKKSLAAAKERRQAFSRANNVADMRKYAKEEAEQIDELSTNTLRKYREKARIDAFDADAVDDDRRLRKRSFGHNQAGKKILKRGDTLRKEEAEGLDEGKWNYPKHMTKTVTTSDMDTTNAARNREERRAFRKKEKAKAHAALMKGLRKEEVEELDELSRDTLRRYRMKAKAIGDNEKGDIGYRSKGRDLSARKTHGGQWGIPKAKVMAKEEVEDLDEAKKKLPSPGKPGWDEYVKNRNAKAKRWRDSMSKARTVDPRDPDTEYEKARHKAANPRMESVEQIDEKLTAKTPMGTYIKDFQKSDAPQFKGKSKEKRRVMAIAAKLTAERGGKPLRKEEKLANLLGDLTESHRRTMLSVFDKLNEDNQKKFLEACETPEGVEYMLDFSISHRGE